jgi:hypothetical protein
MYLTALVQGLVFAATEAEWKAYEHLSCKPIIGVPLSPPPNIMVMNKFPICEHTARRQLLLHGRPGPLSVRSMLQRLVGGEPSISQVAQQKPLTS